MENFKVYYKIHGFVQDCIIPIAKALELPQPCTWPTRCVYLTEIFKDEQREWNEQKPQRLS